MNVAAVIKKLETEYPNKNIVKNSPTNPTEIVCELGIRNGHGLAIAVIDKSVPHYHKITIEVYEVIKGRLKVYKNNKKFVLTEGEKITVNLGEIHYAGGSETWVKVISIPPWSKSDHYIPK